MSLKRKRSTPDFLSSSSDSTGLTPSPPPPTHYINEMFSNCDSPMAYSPPPQIHSYASSPSHLHSRTRKRFRNKPDEAAIHRTPLKPPSGPPPSHSIALYGCFPKNPTKLIFCLGQKQRTISFSPRRRLLLLLPPTLDPLRLRIPEPLLRSIPIRNHIPNLISPARNRSPNNPPSTPSGPPSPTPTPTPPPTPIQASTPLSPHPNNPPRFYRPHQHAKTAIPFSTPVSRLRCRRQR